MLRRDVLRLLGATVTIASVAGAPVALGAPLDPLKETARAFNSARKKHALLAGWEGVAAPGTAAMAANVSGRWPKGLHGTLFRNGPGLFERAGQRYQHWFDGDGLIQAWRIGEHGVSHQSRFVTTPKFIAESASGRFEVMAAGTTIPNARAVSGPDDVNTANISVLQLAGKTYALWEAGSAFEIDPETLETIGAKTWRADLEGAPFSAHPVYEPDGSIWNAGVFGDKLLIYHVGADGALKTAQLLSMPREGYMHSFTASASRLVFVLAPLVRVRDAASYFESLGWREELGSLMVVVPKADLAAPRFAEFESGAAYHYADAWDEADGTLGVRACWYGNQTGFVSPFANLMRGDVASTADISADWVEVRLNRNAQRAELTRSAISQIEFPIATRLMRKSPHILLKSHDHPVGALSGVLSLDAAGNPLGEFDFGHDFIIEEQLYVRHDGKRYTLGTLFNAKKARTGLVLIDLDRLSAGPVAQAWLERAMPLGFHGTFVGT